MGLGNFSEGELRVLEEKFSAVKSGLDTLESRISTEVQQINTTVSSMKATGGTILDEPTIKKLFDEVREKFFSEQHKLSEIIFEFKTATEVYETKRQELYDKEEDIIARESQADKEFASKREIQMAPLRELQEELDKKQHYLMSLQEEYNDSFRKKEQQMIAEFKKLNEQLHSSFQELQEQIQNDRQNLAVRENAIIKREQEVLTRETEVKEGLTEERSRLMEEIVLAKSNLEEQRSDLTDKYRALQEAQSRFESEQGELTKRQVEVYRKECIADQGFAEERMKMEKETQKMRQDCLENIKNAEISASEKRNQLLKEAIAAWEQERSHSIASLNEELAKCRADAEIEIKQKQKEFQQEKMVFQQEKNAYEVKLVELQKRETGIKIEEARQAQEKEFLAEKMRIDEEKFRKIAEEKIFASTEEAKAVREANNQLSNQLTSLRLQYEEQKAINNRFKDQSAEEVYSKLNNLEIENKRLLTQIKNHGG